MDYLKACLCLMAFKIIPITQPTNLRPYKPGKCWLPTNNESTVYPHRELNYLIQDKLIHTKICHIQTFTITTRKYVMKSFS